VGDYLRSLTPVAVMMSGGLDSSSVAAIAAPLLKQRGERLAAFTEVPRAGFDGPVRGGGYGDETPFVQAIAAMHDNLDLSLIRTDGRTFLDDLDPIFSHLDAPFRNTSNSVWIRAILQEARQRGICVMLDGAPGNLTTSWEGKGLLPELLRRGQWARAVREARAMARRGAVPSALRVLVGQGIMPLLPAWLWRAIERLRGKDLAASAQPWRVWTAINPEFAIAQRVDERAREVGHDFYFRPPADCRKIRYKALSEQDGGVYNAAFRSMFGVDSRCPLADVRLAEFSLALPEEQQLRDGQPRSLVRRAMVGRLPPEVLANYRRGLQAADWFERLTSVRHTLPAELDRLERCDLACRALDLARMRRLVEDWPDGGWDTDHVTHEYNCLLERGLMVGRFLRWFEEQK